MYMEKLPEPFNMVEVEMRVREKTPYVVVALQVGMGSFRLCGNQECNGLGWLYCSCTSSQHPCHLCDTWGAGKPNS
jgi:hypothetical protein